MFVLFIKIIKYTFGFPVVAMVSRIPVLSRIPGNHVIVENIMNIVAAYWLTRSCRSYATSWGPSILKKRFDISCTLRVALADVRTTNFEALGYMYSRRLLLVLVATDRVVGIVFSVLF